MAVTKERKRDLQIVRICNGSRLVDKISIDILHTKAKLLSLEQRRQKQLYNYVYVYLFVL